ncbi:hypothetical protein Bbelb_356790 [Branchiostoma belcheri]|nr:hypothetical protein Bbelb_356790 [Branchiostoma belcheri]
MAPVRAASPICLSGATSYLYKQQRRFQGCSDPSTTCEVTCAYGNVEGKSCWSIWHTLKVVEDCEVRPTSARGLCSCYSSATIRNNTCRIGQIVVETRPAHIQHRLSLQKPPDNPVALRIKHRGTEAH